MNPLLVEVLYYGASVVKKSARVTFNFLKEQITELASDSASKTKKIALSRSMDVVENNLSVLLNYSDKQAIRISQDITDDLSIIKGQNEILFLSNSIEYFLKSHKNKTGIDRAISYALQYDIAAVLNHIKKNQQLRFPGYMLHQCNALATTICEYNIFYDSILNDGHVLDWTQDAVNEELDRKYGPHGENSPIVRYMPYEYNLNWIRSQSSQNSKSSSRWPIKIPLLGAKDEILDEAHDTLVILSKELIANEALERRIIEKLMRLPEKKLIVE